MNIDYSIEFCKENLKPSEYKVFDPFKIHHSELSLIK